MQPVVFRTRVSWLRCLLQHSLRLLVWFNCVVIKGKFRNLLKSCYSLFCSETAKLHAYAPYTPMRLTYLRAFSLTNKHYTHLFFVLCCAVSIVRYDLTLKNPKKATGAHLISLKVIKFALIIINSHLYNIIKDLEKKQLLRRV